VLHKLPPAGRHTPLGCGWDAVSFQHIGNRLFTEVVTQLAQLPLEFAISPIRILTHKTDDECLDLSAGPWPPAAFLVAIRSLLSHQLTMPFQYRLGLEQTYHLPHVSRGPLRSSFELGGYHGQRRMKFSASTIRVSRRIPSTFDNAEWPQALDPDLRNNPVRRTSLEAGE
jgi:hypothetical protein